MKQLALALMASVASLSIHAQNLVPNPSFEEYVDCPQSTGELHQQAVGWHSWQLTPDLFHICNNNGLGTAGIPENAWGYQMPITGDGYGGVITYEDFNPEGREYMAAHLMTSLTTGSQYYVKFYASMYDGGSKDLRWCACNNIGMRFFKDPSYNAFPPNYNPLHPDNFAHLNYSEILDDYTNWTLIEGWFTADDDYNWVSIGNFFTDDQTENIILNDDGACSCIYYIENICVAVDPSDCDELLFTNTNKPKFDAHIYPNPAIETVRFSMPEIGLFNVEMYDIQGRIVQRIENINSDHEINVSKFQKGMYMVRFSNNHFLTTVKLIIQ